MIGISFALKIGSPAAAVLRREGLRVLGAGRRLGTALLHRREVARLADLDDRALKDIGLLRSDVTAALDRPLGEDPSTLLMLRSAERRSYARMAVLGPQAPAPRSAALPPRRCPA